MTANPLFCVNKIETKKINLLLYAPMIFDPSTGSARDRYTIRKHSIISLQRKLANLEKSW